DGACHTHSDATSSNRCFPTEAADPSTSHYVNEDVNEGNTPPVKLSKSKRTYSGKSIPRNRYGLGPDSEGGCSSESDCSDCELMEGSSNKLREQWEKAFLRRRRNASRAPPNFEDEAGTSAPAHPVYDSADPPGQQSNARNCSVSQDGDGVFAGSSQKISNESESSEQDYHPMEMDGQFPRTRVDCINSSFDDIERGGALTPESAVHHTAENSTVETPESVSGFMSANGKNAEDLKFTGLDCDGNLTNEVFSKEYSAAVTKGPSQDGMDDHVALSDGQGAEIVFVQSDHNASCGNEVVSSSDQNNIITDRQKIKETDEYKLAMAEELAARQQQLLIQAEEARRLRNRKKADMRIMINERRQKQRVEEIRQIRRKDEENLNLKEKHRVEIKKELHRIEAMCSDMASLLRCLGIHVGGSLYPSPNEVQAAYKRACLKFHPDRMSTTDLRQQVEAEEKFKLISNMKDKFWQNR
uniref:J domain-containing protein n=2 Tax=Chenopodium quinoa TaxID=63459 RepID=A0A803L7P0_CHEQI